MTLDYRCARLFYSLSIAVAALVAPTWDVAAQSPVPGTEGIVSLFPMTGGVAGFHEEQGALIWFKREGDALTETRRLPVTGHVWGVAEAGDTTYVAVGMGRKDLMAPLRVMALRASGSTDVIFEHAGERNQASHLQYQDGKLWMTYFDSKYMTRTGYCDVTKRGRCSFVEVVRMRLGDAVDVRGGSVVIGRPYGETQGQDGDLFLVENGKETLLPSYRGVRSVAFFGDAPSLKIAIGDGWHQNYGQLAQGRLSVLAKQPGDSRYSLSLIERDSTQYGFSKIVPFMRGGKRYLAALGNKTLSVYGPEPEWSKKELYTRGAEDSHFDVVSLSATEGEVDFVVLDRGIRILPR
jgi:hypothetical protein